MADGEADEIPIEAATNDPDGLDGLDDSDEDAVVDLAVTTLASLQRTVTGLRIVAGVAAALWLVALVVTFTTVWKQFHDTSSTGFAGIPTGNTGDELMQTLAATLSNTWGYLIAAVLAYVSATYAETRRATLLLDALAD